MGTYTSIEFRNANDPEFIKAKSGTPEEIEEWEDDNGLISYRPGKGIEVKEEDVVEYTDEEYGGWIIPVDKLPEGTTHIVVSRG
mgnify:CR=1 FL=1